MHVFSFLIIQLVYLIPGFWVLQDLNKQIHVKLKPNIILVMSDDQGYGEVGYYGHPVLKTPHLDELSRSGLRLDRFYAGAPVCSPTRSSVLTGRTNDRSAVYSVGYPMRLQEKTIAQVLQKNGYQTAHFGKWHLDGLKGPGAPVLATDKWNPGFFGFDYWLSSTNYFDANPLLSRNGIFESFTGNTSDLLVSEALNHLKSENKNDKPLFLVIWLSSPHSPWQADNKYFKEFKTLDSSTANHYGEIVEVDHAIGKLRRGLRRLGIADNTILWFNGDNGGVKDFGSAAVGGLRGFKGDVYEGGIRVPCIIEWPGKIVPRISSFPAVTMDIYPTIMDILDLPQESEDYPMDGISLKGLFMGDVPERLKPIGFRYQGKAAFIEGHMKLVKAKARNNAFEMFDLVTDPLETKNLFLSHPEISTRLVAAFEQWNMSVERSIKGNDYKGGLASPDPAPAFWKDAEAYKPFMPFLLSRPEYKRENTEN
jgi:arylsulfatase A-like enzyme